MNPNDHIREFLKYYFDLPKAPEYAILITGLWGSGKTWFIKNFTNHSTKKEKILYVSLYGVQTFGDIDSEFFRLLHPILSSKPLKIFGKLTKGLLKTTINFDLDGDGKAEGSMTSGIPNESILEKLSLTSDTILIFDDIERCSIPIHDLLGYINQYVEHGELKAILIANEEELLKTVKDDDKSTAYNRIKEKLIGRTFEITPEVMSALEHFAADLPSPKAQEIIKNNYTLISQIYESSKLKNLRLVRHALWDFDRIIQSIENPAPLKCDQLLSDLLALFLAYSFEVRSGNVSPKDIFKIRGSLFSSLGLRNGEPNPDQKYVDIRAKYSGFNLYDTIIPDQVWNSLFSTGSIPKEDLNNALTKSKYFQNDNQPNWVKFWYGFNLSDEDFEKITSIVEIEWQSRIYEKLGILLHVFGLFLEYSKHGIYSRQPSEILLDAKSYVDHMIENGTIKPPTPNERLFSSETRAYDGLGFNSREDQNFQELLEYIKEKKKTLLTASYPSQANDLLNQMKIDVNFFSIQLILNNHPDNRYYETAILHHISPNIFIRTLLDLTPESRRTVAYTLKERYSISQFNSKLQLELPWLQEVRELLKSEATLHKGKITFLSINMFIDPYLNDAITSLEAESQSEVMPASSITPPPDAPADTDADSTPSFS